MIGVGLVGGIKLVDSLFSVSVVVELKSLDLFAGFIMVNPNLKLTEDPPEAGNRISNSFAALRGTTSKIELTESLLVDGDTKEKHQLELFVVYNSDDELGVRIREGTDVCKNILHRGNEAVVVNSAKYDDSNAWQLDGGALYDRRISGGSNEKKDKLWPTDGNVDLFHLGTWLLKPLRSDSSFLHGFRETTLDSGQVYIEGENEFGSGKIEVDSRCWLPKRIEWRQEATSVNRGSGGDVVSDIVFSSKDPSGIWPSSGNVTRIEHVVDFDIEEHDGIPYVGSWTHRKNMVCSNGKVVVNVVAGRVTEIEFTGKDNNILTSFDLAPVPEKGFKLYVDDARHLPYGCFIWDGEWARGS